MRSVSTSIFWSLDGVLEADDDWQFPYLDDETFAALTEDWSHSDAALLGRTTFEGFADVRDKAPNSPVVGFLERVARHVVTSDASYEPNWPGTTVLSGDIVGRVAELKAGDGGNILVIGSPTLLRSLLRHRLVDTLVVIVLPIVVGLGPRLTPADRSSLDRLPLSLAGARPLASGAVQLRYVPDDAG